jgi:hypothetical protein
MLAVTALGARAAGAAITAVAEGRVRFYNVADSGFDVYSKSPGADLQAWMRQKYFRMQTYSPYFDSRLSWYPNAWVYKDSYAIKPGWQIFKDHPEWVLRDAGGNMLYIPWGCANGTCPQYAGDFGNPAFRSNWIAEARATLANGYKGMWVDDVNLAWRVGDGQGSFVNPIDPRTGKLMTLGDWRRYFAEFMEEVRAAFPDLEIAHNAIWYAGPTADPYIQRQMRAADYFNLERGATDAGLRGGAGTWGFETWLGFVDFVHGQGRGVIIMDYGTTEAQRSYALAAYLLANSGRDMLSSDQLAWTAPDRWWRGYELDLGPALGSRYAWNGLLRRDFQCGMVLLNEPEMAQRTAALGAAWTTIDGQTVSSVTLDAARAAVLTRPCPLNPPPQPPGGLRVE